MILRCHIIVTLHQTKLYLINKYQLLNQKEAMASILLLQLLFNIKLMQINKTKQKKSQANLFIHVLINQLLKGRLVTNIKYFSLPF